MSSENRIANAQVYVNAPADKVWDALVNPDIIKRYMFGTEVRSAWQEGSGITWKGEMDGKPYEDKGQILSLVPLKKLQYSHFSPSAGVKDAEENYHIVTVILHEEDGRTQVSLTQDNNATEKAKEASAKNWVLMLEGLKKLVEEEA